jgi:hypothetical protein
MKSGWDYYKELSIEDKSIILDFYDDIPKSEIIEEILRRSSAKELAGVLHGSKEGLDKFFEKY